MKDKGPRKTLPSMEPSVLHRDTCLSPPPYPRPCFLFLSVNLIDSACPLGEAKGKWVLSSMRSVQGAPPRFLTSSACHEAVEDPRVLLADTKSEAREVIIDSFRCALLSSPAPRKPSLALCLLCGRVWISRAWRPTHSNSTKQGGSDPRVCQGQLTCY